MRRYTHRLSLNRETLRHLSTAELAAVIGGSAALGSIRTDCAETRCIPPPPPPL